MGKICLSTDLNEWQMRQGVKVQETWRRALGENARHLKLTRERLAWAGSGQDARVGGASETPTPSPTSPEAAPERLPPVSIHKLQ